MAASPIVAQSKVILVCDQETNSFVIAVDKRNGQVYLGEPNDRKSSKDSLHRSCTTLPGGSQIDCVRISSARCLLVATGQRLWWVKEQLWQPKTVPLLGKDILYVHGNTWGTGHAGKQVEMAGFHEVHSDRNRDGRLSLEEASGPNLKESWLVIV